MAESESEAFIEKLKVLLADRELAAKVVLQLNLEKQKLAVERDELMSALVKEGVREAALVIEINSLISQMADLKEKERARSNINDLLQMKLAAAEKRAEIAVIVLLRLEADVKEFLREEDATVSLEEIRREAPEVPPGPEWFSDPHEGPHGPIEIPMKVVKEKVIGRGALRIKDVFVGTRCATVRTLTVIALAPFLLMASLLVLAAYGVYVPFFYDMLVPYWQPWMDSEWVKVAAFVVPIVLLGPQFLLCGRREKSSPEKGETPEESPEKGETEPVMDDVGKKLDEVFGGLDEDANEP